MGTMSGGGGRAGDGAEVIMAGGLFIAVAVANDRLSESVGESRLAMTMPPGSSSGFRLPLASSLPSFFPYVPSPKESSDSPDM